MTSEKGIIAEPGSVSSVSSYRRDRTDLSMDLTSVEDESSSLNTYVNDFLRVDMTNLFGKTSSLRGTFSGTVKGGFKGTMLRVRTNSSKDLNPTPVDKAKAFFYSKVCLFFVILFVF